MIDNRGFDEEDKKVSLSGRVGERGGKKEGFEPCDVCSVVPQPQVWPIGYTESCDTTKFAT